MSFSATDLTEFLLLKTHALFNETRMCNIFSMKLCHITNVLLNPKFNLILSNLLLILIQPRKQYYTITRVTNSLAHKKITEYLLYCETSVLRAP